MATATLRLTPADQGLRMTLDDFLDAEVEDGYRYELARGALEVSEIPGDDHGRIVCKFYCLLAAFMQSHPRVVQRFGGSGEYQFLLPGFASGRHPDVALSLLGTPKDTRGRVPATLAVEVVSEGSTARERDYVTKREEYLAYGLREYWIVDPAERKVTLLVRDGDAWVERTLTGDASVASVALPGLVVPLADLWAEIEA